MRKRDLCRRKKKKKNWKGSKSEKVQKRRRGGYIQRSSDGRCYTNFDRNWRDQQIIWSIYMEKKEEDTFSEREEMKEKAFCLWYFAGSNLWKWRRILSVKRKVKVKRRIQGGGVLPVILRRVQPGPTYNALMWQKSKYTLFTISASLSGAMFLADYPIRIGW